MYRRLAFPGFEVGDHYNYAEGQVGSSRSFGADPLLVARSGGKAQGESFREDLNLYDANTPGGLGGHDRPGNRGSRPYWH